jgi:hypothetical protein
MRNPHLGAATNAGSVAAQLQPSEKIAETNQSFEASIANHSETLRRLESTHGAGF